MLFNSFEFIFLFLPAVLLGFLAISRLSGRTWALLWMIGCSTVFYGYWRWQYVPLLASSIVVNFVAGRLLDREPGPTRRAILAVAVAFNLGLLGYFKYANFFVDQAGQLFGVTYHLDTIILPLAISFVTFQQISYIVDIYRGVIKPAPFLEHCFCVVFFPHLIAGPIVNYRDILRQIRERWPSSDHLRFISIGVSIFAIGLAKKVLLADELATYATPVFKAADAGMAVSFVEAWGGALAYTFQLYFDFSGYSDMAVGLACLFGIWLPFNFNSPYKADSIIEFWRRWHITLSSFLRDYLYIPLGGNRKGRLRFYLNLLITMLLGGLWHGAAWTFVLWGGLHGLFLTINHLWRGLGIALHRWIGVTLTFVAVVVAWVFFRAETFGGAIAMLKGMFGFNGVHLPDAYKARLAPLGLVDILQAVGIGFSQVPLFLGIKQVALLGAMLLIVWVLPNTQQIMRSGLPSAAAAPGRRLFEWAPTPAHAVVFAVLLFSSVVLLGKQSEFLYFNF